MTKVFIVNQPVQNRFGVMYNVSPATQYGEIHFVFTADFGIPSDDPEGSVQRAREVLSDIDHGDYIAWAGGDPLGMVIAATVAADYLDGEIRYLRWDRGVNSEGVRSSKRGYYSPVLVPGLFGEDDIESVGDSDE